MIQHEHTELSIKLRSAKNIETRYSFIFFIKNFHESGSRTQNSLSSLQKLQNVFRERREYAQEKMSLKKNIKPDVI